MGIVCLRMVWAYGLVVEACTLRSGFSVGFGVFVFGF